MLMNKTIKKKIIINNKNHNPIKIQYGIKDDFNIERIYVKKFSTLCYYSYLVSVLCFQYEHCNSVTHCIVVAYDVLSHIGGIITYAEGLKILVR